jgi:O-antigen/teichoic acid export membrane protein
MMLLILQALRKIRAKVVLEQSANISVLVGGMLAVIFGFGIQGVFLAQLAVGCVFLLINAVAVRALLKDELFPSVRDLLRSRLRATLPFMGQGALFSVEKTIGNFFPQGLFFLLSLVGAPSQVGLAKIAVQLASLPRMILLPSIGDLSMVVLAKQKAQGIALLRKNSALIIKHAMALHALITFASMIVLPLLVSWFYGAEYLNAIPLTWALLLAGLPAGVTILNSPLIRVFRKNIYSILQALLSWALMITALLLLKPIVGALPAFAVSYAIGQWFYLSITAYIFFGLLPRRAVA